MIWYNGLSSCIPIYLSYPIILSQYKSVYLYNMHKYMYHDQLEPTPFSSGANVGSSIAQWVDSLSLAETLRTNISLGKL